MIMQISEENNYKLRALKLSTAAISSVVLVEITLGWVVGSLAIVSDGLHALLDALTTFALFIATRASLRPPDEEHMYGHEKFESMGGLVGGIVLIGVALLIMYEAIIRLAQNTLINPEWEIAGFIAVGYTFCVDFFRVGTLRKARHGESVTMKAGLYHAIADLTSTLIALIGFSLATMGMYYGDPLASIVLSILLTYLSVKLVWSSGMELSDRTSKDVTEKVKREIDIIKGIHKCKNLKVRKVGTKTFVEATIQVPDYLSLEEAHKLASEIETNLKKSLGTAEVTIHIEPSEAEMTTEKQVVMLAAKVEGIKEVHEIETIYVDGKLYVTLHAYVAPKLSVEEAHQKAEQIEKEIAQSIQDVENVTVHIEPLSAKKKKGPTIHEGEIRKIVHKVAEQRKESLRIRRIMTCVAGKRLYINIDCCFTQQITIEEAHEIASQVEENMQKHFAETKVTVHMEPE